MAHKRRSKNAKSNRVKDYRHEDAKRKNNPEAGAAATYEREPAVSRKSYAYDPHLDPQLVWAGKAERTSFEIDTVSLHIHERISTRAILRAVQRPEPVQPSLFADPQLPLSERIDFYQHDVNWANRLILGDSLLVMNSMLEREGMAGKVQMIYVDPPYGVKFSSNFQPRIDHRDVKDRDEDLTREPEMIKAFRDTWQLGIHSYLTYLRDRLLLARELLSESGSIFVQISDENLHHVRELLDELFGPTNLCAVIPFLKTSGLGGKLLSVASDFLLWYARDKDRVRYHQLYSERTEKTLTEQYKWIELPDNPVLKLTDEQLYAEERVPNDRRLMAGDLTSMGTSPDRFELVFQGEPFRPTAGRHWASNKEGMERLLAANRVFKVGDRLAYKRYLDDFPVTALTNCWFDTAQGGWVGSKIYVTQTSPKVIARCILMTTEPGDLIFDPTCGSGTAAYVAEQWGRRWITCDTSRVALAIARQRLMTATFPYYKLANEKHGVSGGFVYATVPHVTLRSIAQDEPSERETLYDKPEIDSSRVRVSGPFTVEAIPIPMMEEPEASPIPQLEADARADDIARRGRGSTALTTGGEGRVFNVGEDHISSMIELLRKDGVTFPGGKKLALANLRPLHVGFLHAEAEAQQNGKPLRVAVSFGPRHGPITSRQATEAVQTAKANNYDLLVLAGFSFDPEAQAFVQKVQVPGLTVHFANICPDVELSDLLKSTRGSQLFTVFGQPDVKVTPQKDGTYVVELRGVDIYDPNTGQVQQSSGEEVAAWFLDTDYDGYCFRICQAFFPSDSDAWEKVQRALRGIIDPDAFEKLRGTKSLPFKPGDEKRIAVKVIDFRGNEVIAVRDVEAGSGRAKR